MTTPDLRDWIGRTETTDDVLDRRPAVLMNSILPTGRNFTVGEALPPLWNWLYFLSAAPLAELGRDGHAKKGGFLPPVPLPRRMWAGGRFTFAGDLRIADTVRRRSTIRKVEPKTGKTGPLCFVTVEHLYLREGEAVWREEHDIVYREDPSPGQPRPAPVAPPQRFTHRETVTPSPVMLFRYSALTFNGHRIHYDRDYARQVEGYPGLVFHGPLTATLLADFLIRTSPLRLATFEYRAISPLFDGAPFDIFVHQDGAQAEAWACTPDGALAMKAAATFA